MDHHISDLILHQILTRWWFYTDILCTHLQNWADINTDASRIQCGWNSLYELTLMSYFSSYQTTKTKSCHSCVVFTSLASLYQNFLRCRLQRACKKKKDRWTGEVGSKQAFI